jgi:hypothetical protein
MAFELEPTRTPESLGTMIYTLKDVPEGIDENGNPVPGYRAAYFQIEIILSDGTVVKRNGNLVPHLLSGELQGLLSLADALRGRGETDILGV